VSFRKPLPALTLSTVLLLCGNLIDGLLTMVLIELRAVHEVNPLLDTAYRVSPMAFMVGKLSMVQLSILLATAHPRPDAVRRFTSGGALLYAAVVAYQLMLVAHLNLSIL
jgi:hypothetical protein